MRRTIILLAALLMGGSLTAQQLPMNNQYLVNKFSLSDAYAGYNGNVELWVGSRQMWSGIDGAPSSKIIKASMPFSKNSGFGGTVSSDQVGIFNTFTASGTYAYHLPLGEKRSLSFGLSAGVIDHQLDLTNASADALADPLVWSNKKLRGSTFDMGIGIMFRSGGFNAGIAVPRVIEGSVVNNSAGSEDNTLYSLKRQLTVHLSYPFVINRQWGIETFAVARKTIESPLFYDAAALLKFRGQWWLGATYRKGSAFGVSVGGSPHDMMAFNYTYEVGSGEVYTAANGTHEVTLGFLIGKNHDPGRSSFRSPKPAKPYLN
jgi:type IX secretion system PorP/SprF family membrane protein